MKLPPRQIHALRAPPREFILNIDKARKLLGWEPKTRFSDLVKIMVDADLETLSGNK